MKPVKVILLTILVMVHLPLTAFAQKSAEKGTSPLFKFVVNEDKSVQVYDMQGNLIADKPASKQYQQDENANLTTRQNETMYNSDPTIESTRPNRPRYRPINTQQNDHKLSEIIEDPDQTGTINSSLTSPNLYIYTGSGATNTWGYSSVTHIIMFASSVGNNGNAATGDNWVLGWYASTDMTIGAGDKSLTWTPPQSSLAPGSHVNALLGSIDLDNVALANGTYYAGAYVDDVNGVAESNENDNGYTYPGTFYYGPDLPNLYFYTGSGATNSYSYSSTTHNISFTSSVGNNGGAASFDFTLKWYLSFDAVIASDDYLITSIPVEPIGPGSHRNNLNSSTIDLDDVSGLPHGSYFAGAYIFTAGVIETDDTDNTYTYGGTVSFTNPYPNLYFDTFRANNSYSYNYLTHVISFASSVGNNGGVGSGDFDLGWYLSENTTITAGDHLITTSSQSSIEPSFVRDINSTVVDLDDIGGLPSGTYYAGAFIDAYNTVVESDEFDNTYLYSSTISYTSSSDVKNDLEIPLAFELKQNYPNPFNPATTIEYDLSKDAEVRMTIYDLTGHVVRKYILGHVMSGTHSLHWDGCDAIGNQVTAGVYFYQIQAGSSEQGILFEKVNKMILMK